MNTVWMLSDTGAHNGGTRIVPGSHRSMVASLPKGYKPQFVHTPEAPAGSVLVYNGQCWHSGGSHPGAAGAAERHSLFAHYRKSYCVFQLDPHDGFPSEWWPDLTARQRRLFRMETAPGSPHAADVHFVPGQYRTVADIPRGYREPDGSVPAIPTSKGNGEGGPPPHRRGRYSGHAKPRL